MIVLHEEFQRVLATYYPSWSQGREWRIEAREDPDGALGRCHQEEKLITLKPGLCEVQTTAGIIHEIGHAIHGTGHGESWLQHMREAAEKAKAEGAHELAEELGMHIRNYTEADLVQSGKSKNGFKLLEQRVKDRPEESCSETLEWVRQELGMSKKWFDLIYCDAGKVWRHYKGLPLTDGQAHWGD